MYRAGRTVLVTASVILLLSCNPSVNTQAVEMESDGLLLQGRFFKTSAVGTRPTLLMLPGWPGNPRDVIGMGETLSHLGINVLVAFPRGMHGSEGTATYHGIMEDIGAALRWLQEPETVRRFNLDPDGLFLAGYSWGGGVALAYTARHPGVRRVIAIAGTDHGVLIRKMRTDEAFAAMILESLGDTQMPRGPIRFDPEDALLELWQNQHLYGLRENAEALADRSVLLLGGVDDENVTLEDHILPLYRALNAAGAEDVTIEIYQDDHAFEEVREEMAEDIAAWIRRHLER